VKTPHIDRLGRRHSRSSFCTTSSAPQPGVILSGLYALTHGVVNNFTKYPNELPSFRGCSAGATAYIGKYHMGEENDEQRPGFDYFVTHKGQGKYFDTEFNVDGTRQVVPGYYTHVVTDLADKWLRQSGAGDKPFLLMLGHKAPHSFYFPEPKYEHAFDNVKIRVPSDGIQIGRQAEVVPRSARYVARHLRPADRVSQGVSRSPAGSGEGLCRHDPCLLGHDPLGR
jgi:N-acetylglucosamine-6-sulfatase